jgi:hypothetical protein
MSSDDYALLLDESADGARSPILELPEGSTVVDAGDALEALFAADRDTPAAVIKIGDDVVGVSSRARLVELGSSLLRSVGDGDGATLPGASLRYRILYFRCPTCGARVRRIHVDPRTPPECPNHHGAMELQP